MSRDHLGLAHNSAAQKMLSKLGDNFPDAEEVVMSVKLIKINKRGKKQTRVLLLTDKALYNLKPKDYSKCQRRIELSKLVSITQSGRSQEFAIHVPDEYDYRFESEHKQMIIEAIQETYTKKEGKKLHVSEIKQESVASKIVTKDVARVQTREERLRRWKELVGETSYADEVDDAKMAVTGHLIGSSDKDKVTPDDFEFLKVIGRGTFGKVMQVKKKDTGAIYAMKILKKKSLIQQQQVEHTNAERNILRSMDHPFLMHLRYAFQTEAKLYFVLDYYRGGELFFHLKLKRRFSEKQARFMVAEVGMGLGHLHSFGIIYRDLKPENILLDHEGHLCLTDFGLSKDLEDSDGATTFCGTPEYLAPEIVASKKHGKPVDWWALGILLYELTVGIPPFYSQNINEMYRKIQEAPLLFPPSLSPDCKDLITQLLQRDPRTRLGSKNDFDGIQVHKFFKTIDFDAMYRKEIKPPYKPASKATDDDTSCFDEMFLSEKVVDTHCAAPMLEDDGFGGFTFAPTSAIG